MAQNLEQASQSCATMYDIVQYWTQRTPEAPAILAEGRAPLNYRALLQSIDAIGMVLNALGIGRNDRVAILHPGGAEMATAIMGIWCHAAAAPLNPAFTVGEFAVYLRDLGVKALAIAEDMDSPARLAAERLGLPVFEIAVPEDANVAGKVILKGTPIGIAGTTGPAASNDVALLLTTSGTTSHSKIVPIRHHRLLARSRNVGAKFALGPDDRCLNPMPLYHSHGLSSGLASPIAAGGCIAPMAQFDIETFFRLLETLDPTWYTAVFTIHQHILAHAKRRESPPSTSMLRFIHTSSGRLDPRIADKLTTLFQVPVLGSYASSETGIMTGDPYPPAARKPGSVGTPAGCEVAIFDATGEPAPVGVRGGVFVRGANVFDGYENDPAATAAAFSDGWYGTGDEGMFDADGYLFLTGRLNETINRGGEKISPSEVDAALLRHPAVAAAATFPIPHATLGEEVAAAVVAKEGSSITVPRRILVVDSIPVSPTGKIQRRALAAAFGLEDAAKAAGPAAPVSADHDATPIERQLRSLWQETLGLPQVGLHDDFFLLGGDSLQAVELFLRIEETLGRRLPRSVLFEAGTIADMARRIEDSEPSGCIVPIRPKGNRLPFFCVHGIDGGVLYFRDLARHLDTAQPFYGIQSVGLEGPDAPPTRIAEMASHYISEIRKIQPNGPYLIGGYSFGGWIAHEMACQLRDASEAVALLALIDTHFAQGRSPGVPFEVQMAWARQSEKPVAISTTSHRVRRQALLAELRLSFLSTAERVGFVRPRLDARFRRNPAEAHGIALRRHRPRRYDGDAVLFHVRDTMPASYAAYDGWKRLIGGRLRKRPVAGSHYDMMYEPHVLALARALAAHLPEDK
jgi:oxalate---CoA ligase